MFNNQTAHDEPGMENDINQKLTLVNNTPGAGTDPDSTSRNDDSEGSTRTFLPDKNIQDSIPVIPCVCEELEQVNRAEQLIASIKINLTTSLEYKEMLANIEPEIEKLITALAEKQAEAERLKDNIDNLELERMELKEKLIAEMGV